MSRALFRRRPGLIRNRFHSSAEWGKQREMELEPHLLLRERTGFDPFLRLSDADLALELNAVAKNPIMNAVLDAAGADMMVVNRHLQVVASNSRAAHNGNIARPVHPVGKRLGEIYGCAVSQKSLGGCGTEKECAYCGALKVILSAVEQNKTAEGECLMRTQSAVGSGSGEYHVRATPVEVEGRRFTVVSMNDISDRKQRELLERIFVHDLKNAFVGIIGWSDLLAENPTADTATTASRISALVRNVAEEIETHRLLTAAEAQKFTAVLQDVSSEEILRPLKTLFSRHESAYSKHIEFPDLSPDRILHTDPAVLRRVLVNMILNALEATPGEGTVRIGFHENDRDDTFTVWNRGVIPKEIAAHIFKRSFSTKSQPGRGLGTYSMKIFGEDILGGTVSFITDQNTGTEFRIALPRASGPESPP